MAHHILSQSPKEFRPPQHPKDHQGVGTTTFSHVSSSCQLDKMGRIKHRKERCLHRNPRGWVAALDKDLCFWLNHQLVIHQEKRSRLVAIGSAGETGIPALVLQSYPGVYKPLALPHPFPLLGAQVVIPGPQCQGCDTTHPHLLQSSSLDLGFGSVPVVRSVIAMEAGWGHSLVPMSWQKYQQSSFQVPQAPTTRGFHQRQGRGFTKNNGV